MAPTVTDVSDRRRFEIAVDGAVLGFAEYRRRPGVISFLHTEIDPTREGDGLGTLLVKAALDTARAGGWRCCPTAHSSGASSTVIASTSTSCRWSDAPTSRWKTVEALLPGLSAENIEAQGGGQWWSRLRAASRDCSSNPVPQAARGCPVSYMPRSWRCCASATITILGTCEVMFCAALGSRSSVGARAVVRPEAVYFRKGHVRGWTELGRRPPG
jgi:predicted GNAT family acetyltransferase